MVENLKGHFHSVVSLMESELNQLQVKTDEIQKDIDVLTEERDKIGVAPYKLPPGRVLLDIGGSHFATTFDTLTKVPDSLLGRMFSGRFPIHVNEDDGRIFVDRDGTYFDRILKFLRNPDTFDPKMKDKNEYEEFKTEVEYYGLLTAMFGDMDNSTPDALDWLDNKRIRVQSFSSQLSGFPASNTLDSTMTYWLSESGQTTNQWIVYEFPSVCYVNKIMIKVDSFECTAKEWSVQINSNDDPSGEWETVKDFESKNGTTNTSDQFFEDFEVRAKYIRLFFKNNWGPGGGSYILVTNVKFYGGSVEE